MDSVLIPLFSLQSAYSTHVLDKLYIQFIHELWIGWFRGAVKMSQFIYRHNTPQRDIREEEPMSTVTGDGHLRQDGASQEANALLGGNIIALGSRIVVRIVNTTTRRVGALHQVCSNKIRSVWR
jgi:hypothetical protein